MVQAGTTCPTLAQDYVADAWSRSAAWQTITETSTQAAAAEKIFTNELPPPVDGHAFVLSELMELRTAALVLADPEEPYTIRQGTADGYAPRGGVIVVIVERWIRQSEANDSEVDQSRWLEDKLALVMEQVFDYLTANQGPRWMQSIAMKQTPLLNHVKEHETIGLRQQAAVEIVWGIVDERGE